MDKRIRIKRKMKKGNFKHEIDEWLNDPKTKKIMKELNEASEPLEDFEGMYNAGGILTFRKKGD